MRKRSHKKLVHEGNFVAEVEVQLIDSNEGWAPYLSRENANKLDEVRKALRKGDMNTATRLARVYELIPVNV